MVEARAPDQGRPEGRIEAVARTPIMGFRDDVIVRVRAFEGGARVDVRSSSRYGSFDFGANAARVRALLEDIEAEFAQPGAGRAAADRAAEGTGQGRAESAAEGAAQGRTERQSGQAIAAVGRRRAVGLDLAARSTRSSRCASTDRPAAG